ncbi:hypothetical protein SAMN05444063_13926 [Pseudomonas syringae]|nr:hypothetical protein SAMN05444063_13926 [Pseudomonas syringae]
MGYPVEADNSNLGGFACFCETCSQTELNASVITFA